VNLPVLSGEIELVLYRVTQESLTNIARHADATRAELSLNATADAVVLHVVDDGHGGVLQEGAGIRGMRERALLVGADLAITTPTRGGTDVRLVVPMTAQQRRTP
jgi:two-component system, NarL family, sensor histidine kinase UhpB